MKKIKHWVYTVVSFLTGMRKLLVYFSVASISLWLHYQDRVTGELCLTVIRDVGIAYVTANVFTKCIDLGKQWLKRKK